MPIFTIILEFQGGTYIDQVAATDPHAALLVWAGSRVPGEIRGLGAKRLAGMIAALSDPDLCRPMLLHGLKNVWCAGSLGLPGGLLNLVQTDCGDA